MPKQNRHRGPIWALLLLLLIQILVLHSATLQANTIVQPSGSSCVASQETASLQAPAQLPEIKLSPNNSIQLPNNNAAQLSSTASPQQQQQQIQRQLDSARQVAFETICDGWENSISSRAFWLLDKSRRALIAKFLYQDKTHFYEHPEAKMTSPIFPSIPLLHSMEDSKYYESCRIQFKIYSTIASQIDVLLAPIQTVAAGSVQMPAASSSQHLVDSYVIDVAKSTRNRNLADKLGEASVWQQREIIMPKSYIPPAAAVTSSSNSSSNSNSNRSIPVQPSSLPYKIEISAVPTRVTSAETPSSGYLVGIALANITLSPECFGLNIEEEELARVSYFEQQQSPPTQRLSGLSFDRIVQEHKLLLVLFVIGVLIFVTLIIAVENVYCASRRPKNKSRYNDRNKRRMVTQRQRVYASDIKPSYSNNHHFITNQSNSRQQRDEMMQKHQLHPLSLSLVENVQLRENPNYASLAHEFEQEQQQQQQQTTDYIVRYEPDEWEIDMSKVVLGQQVGTGAFGMVYSGQLIGDDGSLKRCAIKTLPATATLKQRMDFLREASIMKQFNTQHVVKLLGVVSTTNPVYVIMEFMEFGDLKSHLRSVREVHHREGKTLVEGIYLMVAQIADGMAYLASKKFVHRDLAARNCMVGENRVVKIGDFGLTRDIYVNDYYRRDDTHGRLPVRWMAPESLLDNIYTSASDVWSFGIVVWEIVTFAAYPYQGQSNDEVIKHVSSGFTMSRPDNCPSKLFSIMQRCWLREPNERPTFCDLVAELMPETGGKFYPSKTPVSADERSTVHESYHQMISDDRKPLVALYPVVH